MTIATENHIPVKMLNFVIPQNGNPSFDPDPKENRTEHRFYIVFKQFVLKYIDGATI